MRISEKEGIVLGTLMVISAPIWGPIWIFKKIKKKIKK